MERFIHQCRLFVQADDIGVIPMVLSSTITADAVDFGSWCDL